jgi:hypothetical protein
MVRFIRDLDIEFRVLWDGEGLSTADGLPILTVETITAGSAEGFHDFTCTGGESERSRENDTYGLAGTIGQDDRVADALFTVDIGFFDEGDIFKGGSLF